MNKLELRSTEINEITSAMIKAQKEFDSVEFDRTGKFKYASVKSILSATKKHLLNYDIRVEFKEDYDDQLGLPILYTVYTHGASGQYTASRSILTVEDEANSHTKSRSQRYGAALTYHMRYSLMTSLGICADLDDIDEHDYAKEPAKPVVRKVTLPSEKITKEQLTQLNHELKDCPNICKRMKNYLKIDELSDMPQDLYQGSVDRIRQIISTEGKS